MLHTHTDAQLCGQRSLEWVGPAMMCSQSPHCPDSLGTPSPTPSLTPRLPTFLPPALPWTLLLLHLPGSLTGLKSLLVEFWRRFALYWRSSLAATMVHSSSICRFLLLVFLGLLVAFVHTGKPPVVSDFIFIFKYCVWVCNFTCLFC